MQGTRHKTRWRTRGPGRAALACLTATALLGLAVPARSDTEPAPSGLATLVPDNAGAPSHLKLDAEGPSGGLEAGKLPNSLAFAFQNGFTVAPSAVPGVCSNSQANNNSCPDNSRFASGTIDLVAHGGGFAPGGSHYTADLTLYIAPPQQAGDPAGAVFYFVEKSSGFQGSSLGRIITLSDPTYGTEVRFDKLPLPQLPPGFTFDLQSLKLDVGVESGQTGSSGSSGGNGTSGSGTTPGSHRSHRHRRSKRKHRHGTSPLRLRPHAPRRAPTATSAAASSFLTNPTTCSGTWSIRLQIGFADGEQERDASAPCTS